MHPVPRTSLAAIAGAAVGYFCLFIVANLEDIQFYTIRSLVTGKESGIEIISHPADEWVAPVLLVVFVLTGSVLGILTARRRRPTASP
jgi:hypothetical protein